MQRHVYVARLNIHSSFHVFTMALLLVLLPVFGSIRIGHAGASLTRPSNDPRDLRARAAAAEAIDLPVTALNCAVAPGSEEIGAFYANGTLPAQCDAAEGVTISIEANGVPVAGSPFTTDSSGQVVVRVALGSSLAVTEDAASVPSGYTPLSGRANGVAYANPVRLDPVSADDRWGVLFVNVSTPPLSTDTGLQEGNTEAVVRALYEQVYSQGELDLIDELYAPDYVEHQVDSPPGRDGVQKSLTALRTGFPDLTVTIEDITVAGDKAWVLSSMRGTHLGQIFGVPASGRQVEAEWFDVYQVVDGVIIAHWGVGDELGLMQQLGFTLVPPTPTPAGA